MTDNARSNGSRESGLSHEAEAKINEVEAAIRARRKLKEIDENVVGSIISYVEEKIAPFRLNNTGVKGIEKLYKKFDHTDIIDAIDMAADRYLKYDSDNELERESVETYIKKIGGILNLKGRPPIDQKIAYVKGICRNRFNYWNDWKGAQLLQAYIAALRRCKYSEDDILADFDEELIPSTKTARNWSQWRDMMERWTEQVEGWANDLHADQHEQQSSDQANSEALNTPTAAQEGSLYIEEKRRGGANSYQAYKPLRDKVEELCINELNQATYSSANQLCSAVAAIIENECPDLLCTFQPYQNYERDGNDWKRPTFYGWCNSHYKAHRS